MDEDWLRFFKGSPGLRTLKVEYETLSWKKEEMMRIIQRNKAWKLPVRREDGSFEAHELEGYLSAEKTELKEWKWQGTSKLGGQTWNHHGTGDTVEYVVVMDTWKFVEGELSEKELEGRLGGYRSFDNHHNGWLPIEDYPDVYLDEEDSDEENSDMYLDEEYLD